MRAQRLFATLLLAAVLGGCAQANSAGPEPAAAPTSRGSEPAAAPTSDASEPAAAAAPQVLPPAPPTSGAPAPSPAPAGKEGALDEVTGTWYSADGAVATRSASSFEVHAIRGHPHCDTQSVVFLSLLWPVGRQMEEGEVLTAADFRQYVRDRASKLDGAGALAGDLDLAAKLPAEATNTGYSTDSVQLWLGPDGGDRYAYLVFDSHTERWPRAREAITCA